MKKTILGVMVLILTIASNAVMAHPHIATRQMHQRHRIAHGVCKGEITRGEAMRLHRQQRMIQHDKRIAMADGHISPRERQIINREQNHAGRNIYRMKHNNRYR